MTDREIKILEDLKQWIRDCLKLEHNGISEVMIEDVMYTLKMHFASDYYPWIIHGDFENDEEFLKYAKEKVKQLLSGERAEYYRLQMKDYQPE